MANNRRLGAGAFIGFTGFAAGVVFTVLVAFTGLGLMTLTNYHHFGSLINVINKVEDNFLEPVNTTKLVDGAIKGLVESLEDPYSVYLDPQRYKELQTQIQGSFGGLGIQVAMKGKNLTVVAPIKGTPAYRAGIKSGDVISKIGTQDVPGMDIDRAVDLMRGPVGTTATITITREEKGEKKSLVFNIVRENISVPSVEGSMVKGKPLAYIQLSMFNENTADELSKTLAELKKESFRGIILDLRFNPGGELQSAVSVANYFVPKGRVVTIRDKNGREEVFEADGKRLGLPLVVLVNGYSASASEIVAGAIKDTGSGTLVGTKTFGKGIVQTIYPVGSDAALKITTAKYLTPKGHDINKKGIIPDVVIDLPKESTTDVQLEKAIEILIDKLK
ncbi:MAG TPA: S41 family peptidase [Bacillota bacterium]|nr:S41 family peptidase [Bacillota bacterium]